MDSNAYIKKRNIKQAFLGLVFILILIFGWGYPVLGFFIPLCMILGISIGLFRGRKWCDWYCPRGSFWDYWASHFSPKKNIPKLFKAMPTRIIVLLLLMSFMVVNLLRLWPHTNKTGLLFMIMVTATTLVGVILTLIYHQRSWCAICPVGTLINLTARNNISLKINSELCIDCKLCEKVCPVQIKPYVYKAKGMQFIKDRDCLRCGICVVSCPVKALSLS